MIRLNHHDRDIEDAWLRARLAMLPAGARILDVGCVDGWVLDEYPGAWGVDARPGRSSWDGRVHLCDAETIPFPAGSFDAVTCVSVLEHVGLSWYGDPAGDEGKAGRIVADMARVLQPGGWMFLTVPIGLTMTKDGRPFAREILQLRLDRWIVDARLDTHEWLTVTTHLWSAAPDDDSAERSVVLVAAHKPETGEALP